MNNSPLGKNQQALMSFLWKHPNRWHSVRGRKAIEAAERLAKRYDNIIINKVGQVSFRLSNMLIEQAA